MLNFFRRVLLFKQGNIFIHLLRYRYIYRYPGVKIDFGVEIWDKGNKLIGRGSWLRKGVIIQDGILKIGNHTHLGPYSCFFPGNGIQIGNNVLIGPHVGVYAGTHNMGDRNITIGEQGSISHGITIEDDVWIGANVTILDGVTIKKGSIIGAGAVVNKDTKEYSISVGVPSKIINFR